MTATAKPANAPERKGEGEELGVLKLRVWQGMPLSVWLPLLARNRFAVSPSRILQAGRMTVFSVFNSLLHGADRLLYGRRVARTPTPDNPLFILGHWRTGTTLLHELFALDERLTFP